MKIEIPEDILRKSNLSEKELKLELALFLYQKNILTLESASKLAEVDSYAFQKVLGQNKIPMHYTKEDFENDLQVVNEPEWLL